MSPVNSYAQNAATAAAGIFNYDLLNGRSERIGESMPILAALRVVEALTRPISAAEALNSPAVARGLAAEQLEDEEHEEQAQNSAGNLRTVDIGGMDAEHPKSMHSKIIETLAARGGASVKGMVGAANQSAELDKTVRNKAMSRDANIERAADKARFPSQGHFPDGGRHASQQTAHEYCTETIGPAAAAPDTKREADEATKDAREKHKNIGPNPCTH